MYVFVASDQQTGILRLTSLVGTAFKLFVVVILAKNLRFL